MEGAESETDDTPQILNICVCFARGFHFVCIVCASRLRLDSHC